MMKAFIIRLLMLTTVLLFGILFGIYHSHHGLFSAKEKHTQVEHIQKHETIIHEGTQKVEEEEKKVKAENEKEQQLIKKLENAQELSAVNFYSDLGTKIGEMVHHIFSTLIFTLIDALDSFINKG